MKRERVCFESWPYVWRYPWRNLRWLWDEALECIERAVYGYSRGDTWRWASYLTTLNRGVIARIMETRWSSPGQLCHWDEGAGAPDCAVIGSGCTCAHDQWRAILTDLLATFDAIQEDEDDVSLLAMGWEAWKPIHDARNAKIEAGLALYAKWFRSVSN